MSEIIGTFMNNGVMPLIEQVARSSKRKGIHRILLYGERGTGKGLLAEHCHATSERSGPYVPVNAAILPETLAASELFGHAKGAFTGATRDRTGLIMTARRGTLFIDELDKLARQAQYLLLRFLDSGEVRRVGDDKVTEAKDLLVIGAAMDLDKVGPEIRDRFEETFEVPPLRDRITVKTIPRKDKAARHRLVFDAAEILQTELSRAGVGYVWSVVVDAVVAGYWPGNVRELRSLVRICQRSAEAERDLRLVFSDRAWRFLQSKSGCKRPMVEPSLVVRSLEPGVVEVGPDIAFPDLPFAKKLGLPTRLTGPRARLLSVQKNEVAEYCPPTVENALRKGKRSVWKIRSEWLKKREQQWQRSPELRKILDRDSHELELPWDVKELEKQRIQEAVQAFGAIETKQAVAARLGISPVTLGAKLRNYGVANPWKRAGRQ